MRTFIYSLVMLVVAGCGPGGDHATISAADHADALTTSANDNLFTLTVTASSKDFALSDIMVVAALPGQTAVSMNFTHNDTNGDGKLNQGESLAVKEPPVNLFDATTVGKAVTITLDERPAGTSGTLFTVGSTTWTPAN